MASHRKRGRETSSVRPYGRLKVIGTGLALVLAGILRMLGGVQVVTHGIGQPMFSWGLVTGGALCILLSLIPATWIASAIEGSKLKARKPHHE